MNKMMLEEAIKSHISGSKSLDSMISGRLFPLTMPQGTQLPAITYQKISENRSHSQGVDSGLTSPVYQFSCWGSNYGTAAMLVRGLRLAFQDFNGLMGGENGVFVQSTLVLGESDDYIPDTNTYLRLIDIEYSYVEDVKEG